MQGFSRLVGFSPNTEERPHDIPILNIMSIIFLGLAGIAIASASDKESGELNWQSLNLGVNRLRREKFARTDSTVLDFPSIK